jgi:hypothetical protein
MAATQTTARGLTTDDLTRIRLTLAAGRKPRVMFTDAAGQVAGQVGQVVQLTDPTASDEWVVVRFGRDELPFSPADLAMRAKTVPAKSVPAKSVAAAPVSPPPAPQVKTPGRRTAGAGSPDPRKGEVAAPPPAVATPPSPAEPAGGPATQGGRGPASQAAAQAAAELGPPRRAAARKAAKPKAPPSLTVTLSYTDGEWMVGATQGTRALAKPYVIKPAEALKMISLLDVPGVHEAVDDIVSAARAQAEQRAERLRAELAEVESRLAELRDAS